jgi:hypothetical protein
MGLFTVVDVLCVTQSACIAVAVSAVTLTWPHFAIASHSRLSEQVASCHRTERMLSCWQHMCIHAYTACTAPFAVFHCNELLH